LEKEVQKIIKEVYQGHVELNKIVIPTSKKEKRQLKYARVFFYISNLKEAFNISRRIEEAPPQERAEKSEYEVILNCIVKLLNKNDAFTKYSRAELYEYTKKNQTNVLHIKGIKHNEGEDSTVLSDEIKEFI